MFNIIISIWNGSYVSVNVFVINISVLDNLDLFFVLIFCG